MIRRSSSALLISIGVLFLPCGIQAQKKGIHIKERIAISPLAPRQAQSAAAETTAHTIRAVLSASPPSALRLVVTREFCPGDAEEISLKNYDGTGSVTFEMTDTKPRVYQFFGQLFGGGTATFSLYTDDSLAYEFQETNPSNPWYPAPFDDFLHGTGEFLPFATDFEFRFLQTCLEVGATTTLAIPAVYSCSTPIRWSPERDLIHFRVLEGEGLGEFRTREGTPLGTEFQLTRGEAENMRFTANAGLEQGGIVILEARVREFVKTAVVNVYTPNDLSFAFGGIQDVKFGQEYEFFVETRACAGAQKPPPPDVTYTVQIVEGNEWGTLYSFDTDQTSDTLTGLPHFNGRAYVIFSAWEEAPSESARVVVRVTASDGSIEPATTEFRVLPVGCLSYEITPAIIAPGDTAAIFFREELPDGTMNEYPPDQLFDVSISGGAENGTLLFEGDTAGIWTAIPQGIRFIADSSVTGDSAVALIEARLSEGGVISAAAPVGAAEMLQGDSAMAVRREASRAQMITMKMESAIAERIVALEQVCQAFGVVVVKREEELDHFLVIIEPDTLYQTDTATVYVQAKSADNSNIEIPDETALDFSLTEGSEVSYLWTSDGVLTSIPYGTVKVGSLSRVKLIATAGAPLPAIAVGAGVSGRTAAGPTGAVQASDSLQRVVVRVLKSLGAAKMGEGLAIVKRKLLLSITDHSPWTIWPDLENPTSKGGVTNYNHKRSLVIQVRDGLGNRVVGERVQVQTTYEKGTGGHGHVNGEQEMSQDDQGTFYGQNKKGNPLKELTTSDIGEVTIDSLVASQFSGKYLVTALLMNNPETKDTVNLVIKVPNLVQFPTSTSYDLTGTDSDDGKNHLNNHYFYSQAAIDSLTKAANLFTQEEWNTTGKMRLNDMSLEWGGKFDIKGKWDSPHELHRVGRSVDIENYVKVEIDTVSIYTGKDTTFTVPKAKWVKQFEDFMETTMRNWEFEDEHQLEADVFKRKRKYPHFDWKGN